MDWHFSYPHKVPLLKNALVKVRLNLPVYMKAWYEVVQSDQISCLHFVGWKKNMLEEHHPRGQVE